MPYEIDLPDLIDLPVLPKLYDVSKTCLDCGREFSTNKEKICRCGRHRRMKARTHDARKRKEKTWEARQEIVEVSFGLMENLLRSRGQKQFMMTEIYNYKISMKLQDCDIPFTVYQGSVALDPLSGLFPIESQAQAQSIELTLVEMRN